MNERSTGQWQMSGTESAGIAPRALCYFTWKRRKRIAIEILWKFHQRSLRVFLGRCVFPSSSEEQQDRRGCEKSGKGQRWHNEWLELCSTMRISRPRIYWVERKSRRRAKTVWRCFVWRIAQEDGTSNNERRTFIYEQNTKHGDNYFFNLRSLIAALKLSSPPCPFSFLFS